MILVDADGTVAFEKYVEITSVPSSRSSSSSTWGDRVSVPAWLEPIREGARTITAEDISRFVPPEGADARARARC